MKSYIILAIIVLDSETFVIPGRQNAYNGSSNIRIECYSFRCQAFSWQGPIINMSRDDGRPLRYTITMNDRDWISMSVLTISSLMEEDEGQYFCTCSNGERSGPSMVGVIRKSNTNN